MKYSFIILFAATTFVHAGNLTDHSYKGVSIHIPVADALKLLENYSSTQDNNESSESCYYLIPSQKDDDGVRFMIVDGRVSRIDVLRNSKVATKKGITIGSNKTEVFEQYKNPSVSPHPYTTPEGEYLKVMLSDELGIIFETYHDKVTSFRLGDDSINYIEGCL